MDNPDIQAFAYRYTAELINTAPPDAAVLAEEGFSETDRDAVYRALNQLRLKLLADAKLLNTL